MIHAVLIEQYFPVLSALFARRRGSAAAPIRVVGGVKGFRAGRLILVEAAVAILVQIASSDLAALGSSFPITAASRTAWAVMATKAIRV